MEWNSFIDNSTRQRFSFKSNEQPIVIHNLFGDKKWPVYLIITLTILFCSLPILYIVKHKNAPLVTTRSPMLIVLTTLMLMLDCMMNTLIFSLDGSDTTWICNLSIIDTTFFMFTALICMFTRMYRVYKVFYAYGSYLTW